MVGKENPSSETPADAVRPVEGILVSDSQVNRDTNAGSEADSNVVMAELVEESPAAAVPPVRPEDNLLQANLAARGGAVASVVLGVLSIIGSQVTSFSVINALLGLMLGFWGMYSNVRWPLLGPILCLIGILACLSATVGG